ncbi:YEATS domain-containing protein 4 [Lepeophtheirus salmonis]|uniref:YEATS domain containing protein 4like [Tribolium castaneum] n=2 Tax=Lepeophtheirus salmonis TaxID=72036 RepID=A0A0K2T2N4_LEPSM|nr:YEATS domain-containing protein 4-like [Lepeophtheirus salmonis]
MSGSVDSGINRLKGNLIVKPIVYGNISRHFGKKRESDGHTHDWTIYVKPFNNEDMSNYVKKVQFKLHDSYPNPNRIVTKPPYEVSETGWGEFEVQIKIYFNDHPTERSVTLYHVLKLFHTSSSNSSEILLQGKKAVVSEYYDEVIFQDPTQYIYTLLTTTRPFTLDAYKHETDFEERRSKTKESIKTGRSKVQSEIAELKDKLALAKETISKFKSELIKTQELPDDSQSDIFS